MLGHKYGVAIAGPSTRPCCIFNMPAAITAILYGSKRPWCPFMSLPFVLLCVVMLAEIGKINIRLLSLDKF